MKIFESHAHLDFKQFDKDRDEILQNCRKQGIEYIINVGVNKPTIEASIKLAEKYDFIFASAGFHPHDAEDYEPDFLLKSLKHNKVIALGECGLDYYRNLSPRKVQQKVFADQIQIAIEQNLPLIVHDRDAHDDCLRILSEHSPENVVFHCFSGDEIFAEKIIEKGWHISFTGTITYKKNLLENVVRLVPDDRFFIETDSPYLSPVPVRSKRNSPLNLRHIIERIAEIRNITPKRAAMLSYQNAEGFFLKSNQ